jgi:hypothetical protein
VLSATQPRNSYNRAHFFIPINRFKASAFHGFHSCTFLLKKIRAQDPTAPGLSFLLSLEEPAGELAAFEHPVTSVDLKKQFRATYSTAIIICVAEQFDVVTTC